MVDPVHVRLACRDDVPAVRALLVETWHDTYDALIGAERVTAITDDWHSPENLRRQLDMPDTAFLVAEEKGRVVGHLFVNAGEPPVLAIARLYVLPGRQRRGIGGRLIAAALARHPEARTLYLEVEADNLKGLAFYRREGFEVLGESVQAGIRHLRMEKRLDPEP